MARLYKDHYPCHRDVKIYCPGSSYSNLEGHLNEEDEENEGKRADEKGEAKNTLEYRVSQKNFGTV